MFSRLGRFEIQAEIGHGGFGKVFRALDPVMNRVVAIKVLTAREDAGAFTRFKNEATAAGNLRHENIITIYEFGQEDDTPFLVMEYLNGDDLQHIIKNKTPISLYQKVRIMDQVADGLQCAHRNGVLHRDVKPANIMVLKDGPVKIMDFGIARLVRDTSTRLTQQGFIIGTVVYMAPELFVGSEVDPLCDIWSFGVVLYELLGGSNPFHQGNVQSEMYRIVNEDVPALPSEFCPPSLHGVLSKLLSREREFRYQTLEDVRYDLQPILKSLQSDEVDRLLSATQDLIFQRRWAEALASAREARRMDPENGTARVLFERAQSEIQRESVRPRVDDLLRRSNDVAVQRKVSEAIELLDAARKLDTMDERVLGRLQELRGIKAKLDEAAKLAGAAGQAYRNKRLTTAFEYASEAVTLDPGNQDAQQLLEKIHSEIKTRETDREVEDELRRARGLMAVDDLEGAMAALKTADAKYPGRADTKELFQRLRQLVTDRERRRELSARLEKAKDLLRRGDFAGVVTVLEELLVAFPNEVEATSLLAYAKQELQAKQRSDEIGRTTELSADAARSHRFDEAIRIIEDGLKKFPEDVSLGRLLRSTHSERLHFERERTFQEGLRRCETLRQEQKWPEALDLIRQFLDESPNNRELLDLERLVRQEKGLAERSSAIARLIPEAEGLLAAAKPEAAVKALEAGLLAIGAEPQLTALLEQAKDALRAAQERQFIESELRHARQFEERGDFATSLRIIDNALLRAPNAVELLKARQRLSSGYEKSEQERRVAAEVAAIEEALNRNEWPAAQAKLDVAAKLFPAETVFPRLRQDLREREQGELDELVRECRRLLDNGQVSEAERLLSARLLDRRNLPAVMALGQDIVAEKRRREKAKAAEAEKTALVAERLRAAAELEQRDNLKGALETLEDGLKRFPQDPDLTTRWKIVGDKIAAGRKSQSLVGVRAALDRSNWAQAMRLIEEARTDYPNDPALIVLQSEALDQRRAFLDNGAAAIRAKLSENKVEDAQILFDQNLAEHTDQDAVRSVAGAIAEARALRVAEEQKRAFVSESARQAALYEQQGDFGRATEVLQTALKKYPADPELTSALARSRTAAERSERDRGVAAAAASIRRDLEKDNLQAARKKLDSARAQFPENPPELAALDQEARSRRDQEVQTLLQQASQTLKSGNLAETEKLLNRQLAPFAAEPAVAALADALNREKNCRSLIQTATGHIAARRFEDAELSINQLALLRPGDPEETRLRSSAEAAREQDRKAKVYRSGRAEADQFLRARKYAEATERLEYLLTQFPGDRQLEQDLAGAVAAQERPRGAETKPASAVIPNPPNQTPKRQNRPVLFAATGLGAAALVALGIWLWPSSVVVSPEELHFRSESGAAPAAQRIAVTGMRGDEAPKSDASWVTISLAADADKKKEFLVGVKPDGLPTGEHAAHIVLSDRKSVPIYLTIAAAPPSPAAASFEVQPASLTFIYGHGEIKPQTIVVQGSTDVPDPTSSQPWVSATRGKSGSGKVEFSVRVSAGGGPPATDTAELIFSPAAKVAIHLSHPEPIQSAPTFDVQPSFLSFAAPAVQKILVTSSAPIPNPQASASWVAVSRRSLGPLKAEFTVSVSSAGLVPGKKYTAVLAFPQQKQVPLEFTVPTPTESVVKPITPPPPVLAPPDVQPAELRFAYKRSGMPPPQTVTATGSGNRSEPSKTAPWLAILRAASGENKTEFGVQVLPENMRPGNYSDDLIFASGKKVHVDLVVFDPPDHSPPSHGQVTWSGAVLNRGDELDIKKSAVLKGRGSVSSSLPSASLTAADLPKGVTVLENPSQDNNFVLRLRNESDAPLRELTIRWNLNK